MKLPYSKEYKSTPRIQNKMIRYTVVIATFASSGSRQHLPNSQEAGSLPAVVRAFPQC